MITKVASFIRIHNLIQKNDIIVAAVSGGRDSMAMLYTLHALRDKFDFELRACHVNHGLRGRDSDMDEALVRDECARLSVPLQAERLTGYDLKTGEDRLRKARYEKFQNILAALKGSKIATAHHLDDQLETFLMRLAKGSYFKGLTAIPVSRPGFIRPFLNLTRKEIDGFVKEKGIPFREDFTNEDTTKLRNNIRHRLTPALINVFGEDFYKGFDKSLNDLRSTYEDYRNLSLLYFEKIIKKEERSLSFKRAEYQQFSDNRRRLFIEYCISLLNPLNSDLINYSLKEFGRFVNEAHTGAVFHFGYNLKALINRDEILFYLDNESVTVDIAVEEGDSLEASGKIISIREVNSADAEYSSNGEVEYVCGDRLRFPLTLRSWRPGDSFHPLGLQGSQKLSDFFINRKISGAQKKNILVLENRDEIVWVVGMRIDERYKINKNCRKIIKLTLKIKKA